MAESGAATCPQVFVVDSQANYVCEPSGRNSRWTSVGQKTLLSLTGLTMFGLVVQGCLIYNLYKKTEAISINNAHPPYNLSDPNASHLKINDHSTLRHVQPKESNDLEPDLEQAQGRPIAHLTGSQTPEGEDNVVQWTIETNTGQSFIHNMGYRNGRLLVEREGYYYLYSKLTFNAVEECSLIQHKVMRHTKAYGIPMELMRSKSFRCLNQGRQNRKSSDGTDLRNSFLAGIFHLKKEDEIFVKLENINKIHAGYTDNSMGAFMVYP